MDIFTTLAAIIILLGLLVHKIRVLAVGNDDSPGERSPSEINADVPSMPVDDQNDDKRFLFDVFLSFRGPDTRNRFIGHLHKALKRSSVSCFVDNYGLRKGEHIERLLKAVRESRILLPIFSKRFAESVWCLKEITEMVEVMKTGKRVDVIPIFFKVEPDDVRNWYRRSLGAFAVEGRGSRANDDEKGKWREALQTLASIHGITLNNHAHRDESELVDLIVGKVEEILNKTPLHVSENATGMDCRVQEVRNLLKNEEQGVNMIGIQGMSGIGKTTIATVVYNDLFRDFYGASTFISNVAEKFRKREGVRCQKQLVDDITSNKDSSIASIADGITKIKDKAMRRKVLIVLDDVDHKEQLMALAGGRDWFGPGSVIIFTSKDEDLLLQHGVEESQIYKPKLLNEEQSVQFLMRHVFKGKQPPTETELGMLREISEIAGGLPLALEVLGPHLSCNRNTEEWRYGQVEKLKKISLDDIEGKLRISFDGLEEEEKEIFLDIACFFVGADCRRAVHYYWEACGFDPELKIKLLRDRSLISVDKENRLRMHDLLRNMGRKIVLPRRALSRSWEMSRLCTSNDIFDLLERDEVPSCEVEGIMLNKGVEEGRELYNGDICFRNMHYLRLLHVEGVNFKNDFHQFPRDLLWLGLPRCSFKSRLSGLNSNLQKLAILNLSNCNLDKLSFFGDTVFKGLKFLDLSSTDLTTTPDFRNFPNLVELTFRLCEKITDVHPSIGELKSLVTLDMRTCTSLKELPDTICQLRSIEVLRLGWCEKLSSLPGQIGKLTSLKELSLNDTGIRKIPESVAQLTSCELWLQRCKRLEALPESLNGWFSSGKLKMFGTPLKITEEGIDLSEEQEELRVSSCKVLDILPDGSCKAIKEFYLTDPTVEEFPPSIGRLQNLVTLSLKCEQLRGLPEWINGRRLEKIRTLELECRSLQTIPESIGSLEGLKKLKLACENLQSLRNSIEKLKSLEIFEVACGNLEQLPLWIGSLRSLRQLKVDCLSITHIAEPIEQLEALEILELHLDNPKALPESITLPKKLKKFSLSCKDLENLPDCVWSLGELEKLSLRGCSKIEALPDDAKLEQLTNLLHLDLSQTGVKEIPRNICCLPKLRSLHVTKNGNDNIYTFE